MNPSDICTKEVGSAREGRADWIVLRSQEAKVLMICVDILVKEERMEAEVREVSALMERGMKP
jgi:hypothetical protein